jgi:hypothetical protein
MDAARMEDARPATLGTLSGQPTAPRPPTTPKRSTTGDVVLAVQSLPAEGDDADGDLTGEGFDEQVVDDHGNRVSMYVRAFEGAYQSIPAICPSRGDLSHRADLFSLPSPFGLTRDAQHRARAGELPLLFHRAGHI